MQNPIDNNNNLTTNTTNTVASLTKKDDEKIKKQNNNNNNHSEEDEDEENDEESGESGDDGGGKKKKKGKKKKERKRLKKLVEMQQLQIEHLEKERYQQQLHINQLSGIDENGDTMINPSSTRNNSSTNYSYTDITIPPPTESIPIGDINWLDINNNNNNNNQTNGSNSLLIPPPPQKVVQNIKPKKGSIYENEIQAFGKRTTSSSGVNYEDNRDDSGNSYNKNNNNINNNNNKVKSRSFFKFNHSNSSDNENEKKQSNKKEPKVSLSAIAAAQGKKIPVWRKVLSDDSKLFSNERTWMSWVGTTFSLGAIGTSIITFFGTESLSLFTGLSLWIIALGFLVYSYIIFRLRRKAILTKGKGPFDDRYGPIALVVMVMLSITLFLIFFIIKKPEPLAKKK